MRRTVNRIITAAKVQMGSELLDQPLPAFGIPHLDPFLLIHHWNGTLPGGQHQRDSGVGPHPHRGFSPITFVFKGNVEHRDSLGNQATVHAGGTQWMFAGRGITHSERMSKALVSKGGELEMIQFWVNAPRKNKMDAPYYQPISLEDTLSIQHKNGQLWIVAGELDEVKGPAKSTIPLLLLRGVLSIEGEEKVKIPERFNCLIYLLDGELEIDNRIANGKQMIVLNNDGSEVRIKAKQNTRYILLAGEPIDEEIVQHGPFVMTNQTEIMEAMRDAQMGKMGILIEEF